MLIAGLGGHAREIIDLLGYEGLGGVHFFEEFETGQHKKWIEPVRIVRSKDEVKELFTSHPEFILAIGNPALRERFYNELIGLGGKPVSVIAPSSIISKRGIVLGEGLNIMSLAFISTNCIIGDGTLINTGCRIHHDSHIGKFCEISPNVTITGTCIIGNNCSIGTSATVMPNISIGNNVILGAGCVVTKNIPDDVVVVGVPGKIVKKVL